MKFTRTRDLVIAGAVIAVLVNLLMIFSYDSLPPLPRLAGATLLLLAVVELVFAQSLRARLAGRSGTKPVPSLVAARAVALAKASSLLGAIMVGAWLGVLVYVLPKRADIISASGDTNTSVIGLVSAAALIAAGLWLEHSCRAPEDRDDPDDVRSP
ncbi:MAG TPA: DUF3180 domain-containing protein [Pseudonocardiaceae bacterium]